jgi:uncharacterized protein
VVVAAIEPGDQHHQPCARLLTQAREARLVPAPVLVELEYLLRAALDADAFKAFLDDCARGAFRIEALLAEDYVRVESCFRATPICVWGSSTQRCWR